MAGGDRHPPTRDLLRPQLGKAVAAKGTDCFGEQPRELVNRLRFGVVLGEVLLDELLQRQRAADAALSAEMFERSLECFCRVTLRGEPPPLQTPRPRTAGPVAVRPDRAAVDGAPLEHEDLPPLHHRSLPSHVASV